MLEANRRNGKGFSERVRAGTIGDELTMDGGWVSRWSKQDKEGGERNRLEFHRRLLMVVVFGIYRFGFAEAGRRHHGHGDAVCVSVSRRITVIRLRD